MKVSLLVLDFEKKFESRLLLDSIKKGCQFDYELIYLSNGGRQDYVFDYYKEGLIDILITKKKGDGGGYGQTDLFRYCRTKYAYFIQNDNVLINTITEETNNKFIELLENGYHCIDLNGDQSGRGVWTDRPHFINVDFFNSLGPFPNFGPGLDNGKWNEQHLQEKFIENNYKIAHIKPLFFADNGKWSVREAGDGVFKHRTDTKQMYVVKKPTYMTDVYPPFDKELEWPKVLAGKWVDGDIPVAWKKHSFKFWPD